MAIDLTDNIQVQARTSTTSVTIAKPTGTKLNDLLLACVWAQTNNWGSNPPTPAGWTKWKTILNASLPTGFRGEVWYIKAGASEPSSYSWSGWSQNFCDGFIWRISGVLWSGADFVSEVFTEDNSADTGTTLTCPSITTLTDKSAVIMIGITSRPEAWNTSTLTFRANNMGNIGVAGDIQAAAGATGNKSFTHGTNGFISGIMFNIKQNPIPTSSPLPYSLLGEPAVQ